jgi:hypothetical protein
MVYAKYRLADSQFLCAWPQTPPYDPATEGVQTYLEYLRPDMRLHRYDATEPDKKRLATAQELAAFDQAVANAMALNEINGPDRKALKSVVIWMAGRFGVDINTAVQEIIAIRKTL